MTISNVIDILGRLTEKHEELLQTGQEKKQAIIDKDLESLMRVMRIETRLVKDISSLDLERAALSRKLMIEKGVRNKFVVTYRQLMGVIFVPEEREGLEAVHKRLEDVLKELKSLNELNQTLLKQSLDFIQFSLELFISPEDESYTYKHPSDKLSETNRFGLYNTKI